MTPAEEYARTERYIRLKAAHPLAACVLIGLDREIDAIQARMSPEEFVAMQATAKHIRRRLSRRKI